MAVTIAALVALAMGCGDSNETVTADRTEDSSDAAPEGSAAQAAETTPQGEIDGCARTWPSAESFGIEVEAEWTSGSGDAPAGSVVIENTGTEPVTINTEIDGMFAYGIVGDTFVTTYDGSGVLAEEHTALAPGGQATFPFTASLATCGLEVEITHVAVEVTVITGTGTGAVTRGPSIPLP